MKPSHLRSIFIIVLTFLLALMLSILPLPAWADWFRPAWVPLVLIYWTLTLPHRVSIGVAWILGLLLDALNGTLLGQHALALAVIAYLAARFYPRIRLSPIWQQAFTVFLMTLLYLFLQFLVEGMIGNLPNIWLYWMPAVTSMILWPWIYVVLNDCQVRFKVYLEG